MIDAALLAFAAVVGVAVPLFTDDTFKGQSGRYFTDLRALKREGWDAERPDLLDPSVLTNNASDFGRIGGYPPQGRYARCSC